MVQALVFYLFAASLIAAAIMVVAARNPVHSVLFLIASFFGAAGLFLLLGAEFVAFILVIVYVGAVAVLFLFVVMMLDIDFKALRQGMMRHVPLALLIGGLLFAQLVAVALTWQTGMVAASVPMLQQVENTRAIGQVLYTTYLYPFQVCGLILLVAMVGAITLTLRRRGDVRRQSVARQLAVEVSDVVEIVKVKTGEGVP